MSKNERSFLNNWVNVGGPDSHVVRQNQTGRQGERALVALDPIYSPSNEQFIYNYRKQTQKPFVQAYGSEVLQFQKLTAAQKKDKNYAENHKDSYKHLAVVTERIPHRLAGAPQLTYPESLYVLDRALEGFETAYEKAGPMRVNDRMIGFNNQGQAKVWVNENFEQNHPSYPRGSLESTRYDSHEFLDGRNFSNVSTAENDMVQDVVNTVENYSEQGRFQEPLASRIHQKNLSFAQARGLVREAISQSRVPVPNRVDLFNHLVRGFRKVTTTGGHTTTTTTNVVQPHVEGYKFNYLPVNEPYRPNIFASRVGEHGIHSSGVRY